MAKIEQQRPIAPIASPPLATGLIRSSPRAVAVIVFPVVAVIVLFLLVVIIKSVVFLLAANLLLFPPSDAGISHRGLAHLLKAKGRR